jgi:hypothetical protein
MSGMDGRSLGPSGLMSASALAVSVPPPLNCDPTDILNNVTNLAGPDHAWLLLLTVSELDLHWDCDCV